MNLVEQICEKGVHLLLKAYNLAMNIKCSVAEELMFYREKF